jgi:hypothetical protein
VGTPERPLSDLGRVSYRSYWTRVLMPVLKERQGSVSIKELSELTCIKPDDIIYTLQHLGLVQYQKGQHVLVAAPMLLDQHLREAGSWGLQVRQGQACSYTGWAGLCKRGWRTESSNCNSWDKGGTAMAKMVLLLLDSKQLPLNPVLVSCNS